VASKAERVSSSGCDKGVQCELSGPGQDKDRAGDCAGPSSHGSGVHEIDVRNNSEEQRELEEKEEEWEEEQEEKEEQQKECEQHEGEEQEECEQKQDEGEEQEDTTKTTVAWFLRSFETTPLDL
jgi:hypothetical protein